MLAREVIETIIDRTMSGKDIDGNGFTPYSESYKNSEEFENWNRGKTQVDLRLTGDMQESIHVENTFGTQVTIAFREELEAAKGHGHQYGSNNLPRRKWFGLNKTEEKALFEKYERLQKQFDANQETLLTSLRDSEESSTIEVENVDGVNENGS